MSTDRGKHIYGLEAYDLRKDAMPIEAIAIIRTLEPNGEIAVAVRVTDGLSLTDKAGMLVGALELTKCEIVDAYTPRGQDDD